MADRLIDNSFAPRQEKKGKQFPKDQDGNLLIPSVCLMVLQAANLINTEDFREEGQTSSGPREFAMTLKKKYVAIPPDRIIAPAPANIKYTKKRKHGDPTFISFKCYNELRKIMMKKEVCAEQNDYDDFAYYEKFVLITAKIEALEQPRPEQLRKKILNRAFKEHRANFLKAKFPQKKHFDKKVMQKYIATYFPANQWRGFAKYFVRRKDKIRKTGSFVTFPECLMAKFAEKRDLKKALVDFLTRMKQKKGIKKSCTKEVKKFGRKIENYLLNTVDQQEKDQFKEIRKNVESFFQRYHQAGGRASKKTKDDLPWPAWRVLEAINGILRELGVQENI